MTLGMNRGALYSMVGISFMMLVCATLVIVLPLVLPNSVPPTPRDANGIDATAPTMLATLAALGAWVGSSTVQHMTGLSLTNPVFAGLGPVGFVGTLGLAVAGLKALMDKPRLEAFGWTSDQSPLRGAREALTLGPTELNTIHYGKGVDRQQSHLQPDPDNAGTFEVNSNGRMQHNVPMDTAAATTCLGVYHSNVLWLGKAEGPLCTCSDVVAFNNNLWKRAATLILVSSIAMISLIVGEVNMLAQPKDGTYPMIPIGAYFASKFFAISFLNIRFITRTLTYLPKRNASHSGCRTNTLEGKNCDPARVKIYRQRSGPAFDFVHTALLFCECAYRSVQGIAHPALETDKNDFVERSSPWLRKLIVGSLDRLCGLSIASVVFFYTWYVSWITVNPRQTEDWRIFAWIAVEIIILGIKIRIMTLRPGSGPYAIRYGHPSDLAIRKAGREFKSAELSNGTLRSITRRHLIYSMAFTKYAHHAILCTVHQKVEELESGDYGPPEVRAFSVVTEANPPEQVGQAAQNWVQTLRFGCPGWARNTFYVFRAVIETLLPIQLPRAITTESIPSVRLLLNLKNGFVAVPASPQDRKPFRFDIGYMEGETGGHRLCIGFERSVSLTLPQLGDPVKEKLVPVRAAQILAIPHENVAGSRSYVIDFGALHSFIDKANWYRFEYCSEPLVEVGGFTRAVRIRKMDLPTESILLNRGACLHSTEADYHTCTCQEFQPKCCAKDSDPSMQSPAPRHSDLASPHTPSRSPYPRTPSRRKSMSIRGAIQIERTASNSAVESSSPTSPISLTSTMVDKASFRLRSRSAPSLEGQDEDSALRATAPSSTALAQSAAGLGVSLTVDNPPNPTATLEHH